MMRGRTIYYQNRRILVFCGEKQKKPHSVNDEFATTAETATTGENAEARTIETSEFAESKSGGAFGSDDDPFLTSATERAKSESGISTSHFVKGTVYRQVLASVNSDIAIDNESKALHSGAVLAESENDVILGNDTKAIPSISYFSKADEGIATGNESDSIKTEQNEKAEAKSGISSLQEIKAKTTSASISEVESGISTLQNVEGYKEELYATIYAGTYMGNTGISSLEVFEITIPISYTQSGYNYAASSIEADAYSSVYAWRNKALEDGDMIATIPSNYAHVFTDDGLFTVTADTVVTKAVYDQFTKYFHLAIKLGNYESQTNITSVEAMLINNISITYINDVEQQVTSNSIRVNQEYVLGALSWLLHSDSSIFGVYYNNQWMLLLGEDETAFAVVSNTPVTHEQYLLFNRYFKLQSQS